MANSEIIKGVSYKFIAVNLELEINTFDLIPTDLNGNVFNEVTIDCNTVEGQIFINLPEISSLNGNWNLSIKIVKAFDLIESGNYVTIIAGGSDKIGNLSQFQLAYLGSNAILTPVSSYYWSVILSE